MRASPIDWKPPVRHRPADHVDADTFMKSYEPTWIDRVMTPEVVGFFAVLIVIFAMFGLVTMASAIITMIAG